MDFSVVRAKSRYGTMNIRTRELDRPLEAFIVGKSLEEGLPFLVFGGLKIIRRGRVACM